MKNKSTLRSPSNPIMRVTLSEASRSLLNAKRSAVSQSDIIIHQFETFGCHGIKVTSGSNPILEFNAEAIEQIEDMCAKYGHKSPVLMTDIILAPLFIGVDRPTPRRTPALV